MTLPIAAFRALRVLSELSPHGMLLLSADVSDSRLDDLRDAPPPRPSRHGSIALKVNGHAVGHWV